MTNLERLLAFELLRMITENIENNKIEDNETLINAQNYVLEKLNDIHCQLALEMILNMENDFYNLKKSSGKA